MAFRMLHLVLTYVLCMPFVILVSPAELGKMSIHDYINYVNPPAVHKYKHANGDSILCVKFTDQISLRPEKQQYGYDKNSNIGWRDTQAGESPPNISGSGLEKRCPEGTVSVREIKHEHVKRAGSVNMFLRRKMVESSNQVHDYAVLQYSSDGIYSAQGRFNIWEPYVAPNDDFSLGQIWLVQDQGLPTTQTIEAGWEVYPAHYGDSRPRLFVYWTNDDYKSTGCRNVDCPGFVLSNGAQNYLGQPIDQVSEDGKDQIDKLISIKREILQGEAIWSLYIEDNVVGYWPGSLFSSLAESTNVVQYGGEVLHSTNDIGTPFSKTHMGSGHFSQEGFPKAAYIRDIQMHNSNNALVYPQEIIIVGKPLCYNLTLGIDNTNSEWGHYMFFGGPGGDNPSCLN
ncbi:protein neprosin-like isoform X2 [Cryptomeria japonica]|uniref:protein neprosin-like isoform X2 n=1 Tax=Cryptomeria japonica TaxID=3369 RepID=UPI0027DA4535|nr:protein neprosin-like isoform X2 [Cryptomeria japonica]